MLVLKYNDTKVADVVEGSQFNLLDGSVVSPAYSGWANEDGYKLEEAPAPTSPSAEEVLLQQRQVMSLSFAQLLIGLVTESWITEAEGEAWLAGTLPAAVLALIATLPSDQQFAAKARALQPSIVLRLDPLAISLGAAQDKTPEEMDTFFQTYANV